jgi:outer membrane beta-barrel protein
MIRSILWGTGLSLFALLVLTESVRAEVIEFPEEELATETVLPKFDRPTSVKDRNVVTDGRFEIGGYYGFNTTEPIYKQNKIGFNLAYHWSEYSAIDLNYAQWGSGLNTLYTDGLAVCGTANAPCLDFSRAPVLKNSIYLNYEWKIFYGKISVTKNGVTNLSVYPIIGAGMTMFEHKSYPGIDFGVGQKYYFGNRVALRADLKFQYSQATNPFLGNQQLRADDLSKDPAPSAFKDKWDMSTILDVGISILL